MIITKTTYRISFFGGGSDYPEWYNKERGTILSSTIDKHIYITCRYLPSFFSHNYRVVWSKIEAVKKIDEIEHPAVRELLKYLKINKKLEIHYDGDLPARSGMGSSSVFVVGLMKALLALKKKNISKEILAKKSINFEQNILNEIVGAQDQTAASYGGFNKIQFFKNKTKVVQLDLKKNLNKLNENLLLIYTGIQRNAQDYASDYVKKIDNTKKANIKKIIDQAVLAEKLLKKGDIDNFGSLLHEAWVEKKLLSRNISNIKLDELYNLARKYGALGGKLLGAGGGGFFLFYMKKNNQIRFLNKNKKLLNIPFKFSAEGSKVIYKNFTR